MKYQILEFEGIVFDSGIMIGSQNFALESTKAVGCISYSQLGAMPH